MQSYYVRLRKAKLVSVLTYYCKVEGLGGYANEGESCERMQVAGGSLLWVLSK